MIILTVFFPLMGFLLVALGGRWFGHKGSVFITTTFIGLSFLLSCWAFYIVALKQTVYTIVLGTWIKVGLFHVEWAFLFDTLTVVMLIIVTLISFLVHLYSIEYMQTDPHVSRFFSYLSLFTFFMLILISAENLLQMFVGWEGVGLCSFLLINFWHTRYQANKSAIKAIVVNRFGDVAFCLAIIIVFFVFKTISFSEFIPLVGDVSVEINLTFFYFCGHTFSVYDLIAFFVFIGAVGKSAQLGLHTWLPDAMEGPTPVSALIHAATMVTAGVFALVRFSFILQYSPFMLGVITVVGALTAFFAATTGAFQYDLKRVIAYSTCSQLGYMVFITGLSNFSLSMFHLVNHAFFKALLFLSAGSVIHAMSDEQDMRRMGGLLRILPFTYVMICIGSFALMGFPFTTGFYSKDLILEVAAVSLTIPGSFAHFFGLLSAFFTSFYSIRLLYLTFLMPPAGFKSIYRNAHEPGFFMLLPMAVLGVLTIFFGYFARDMFVGLGTTFWGTSLALSSASSTVTIFESEFLPVWIKMLPFCVSLLGALVAILLFYFFRGALIKFESLSFVRLLKSFFVKKWFFDLIYNNFIVRAVLAIGYKGTFISLDRGLLEFFGGTGISRLLSSLTKLVSLLQSGFLYNYASLIILGLIMIIALTIAVITDEVSFSSVYEFLVLCLASWFALPPFDHKLKDKSKDKDKDRH